MLLVRHQIVSRKRVGAAMLLAALFTFSTVSARGQHPALYTGSPREVMLPPPAPAATHPASATAEATWQSLGIEQLLEQIVRLQQQRIYIERQQKEAEAVLVRKIRLQQEQIQKLGIMDVEKVKPTPASVNPKESQPGSGSR